MNNNFNQFFLSGLIASDPFYQGKTDFRQEKCTFKFQYQRNKTKEEIIEVIAWGDLARYIFTSFPKNSELVIQGRIEAWGKSSLTIEDVFIPIKQWSLWKNIYLHTNQELLDVDLAIDQRNAPTIVKKQENNDSNKGVNSQ